MIVYGELVDPVACLIGEVEEAYLLCLGWTTPIGEWGTMLRPHHAAGELKVRHGSYERQSTDKQGVCPWRDVVTVDVVA